MKNTKVLWFTGLSGSGKSTIADLLIKELKKRNKTFRIFDGDDVRNKLHKHLGFTPEDIKENNRLIIELCKKEFGKIDFVIVPIISPFRESRDKARKIFAGNFIEVYFNCEYNKCKEKDVKGLYKKAESGEIKNFIGLHVPYEPPEKPEIELKTSEEREEESLKKILEKINDFLA